MKCTIASIQQSVPLQSPNLNTLVRSNMSSDQASASHPVSPSEETTRQQLQLQWQDHFQTREQTWKALQKVSVILLAAIGADFKLHDSPALLMLGSMVAIATFFGMAVTIHHRKVQIEKFTLIFALEDRLGVHILEPFKRFTIISATVPGACLGDPARSNRQVRRTQLARSCCCQRRTKY
jgi:hypothetical protein